MKKSDANKNIRAIIINNNGLEMDMLFNIITKYEDIEVAGIINPMKQREPGHTLSRVCISKGKNIAILEPSDIVYLAAKDGKVSVVTKAETHISNYSLNYWEQKLKDFFFFRCHNSYLINMEEIKEITPFFDNTCFVTFKGLKDKVSVSRRYIKEFRQILGL